MIGFISAETKDDDTAPSSSSRPPPDDNVNDARPTKRVRTEQYDVKPSEVQVEVEVQVDGNEEMEKGVGVEEKGNKEGGEEVAPAPFAPAPTKRNSSLLSYFSKAASYSVKDTKPTTAPSEQPATTPAPDSTSTSTSVSTSVSGNGSEDDLILERTTMAGDWFKVFEKEMGKPYFKEIKAYLAKEKRSGQKIFPPDEQRYSFTRCPLDKIKVVILGQDPYHGPNQAHGLAFSVQKGVQVPPSLGNMYQELGKEYGEGFRRPGHGNLSGWADQGVLLLNASLTVRAHSANSHSTIGWEKFTDAIIDHINKNMSGVVFLLWGAFAGKKGGRIDKKKHLALFSPHPSPLSAHRGFLGNGHFKQANAYLEQKGKTPIDWNLLP